MKRTIEDWTVEPPIKKVLKPIELISCLQGSKNENGFHYFLADKNGYKQYIKIPTSIRRVARNVTNEGHDLIVCDDIVPFLGYWNDGVL